jgi:ribonuclease HII
VSKKTFPQSKKILRPSWELEKELQAKSVEWIIGIDEAGRGPLAGPVVAAAVRINSSRFSVPIDDSKLLSPSQRENAFNEICANADIGIGIVGEKAIDHCNILQATFIAMNNAVMDLMSHIMIKGEKVSAEKVCLLIDGNRFNTDLPYAFRTIIGGDKLVISIACASIVAKVTRDRMLDIYDLIYPQYGFRHHKGYATVDHRKAIQEYGPCEIHRRSFNMAHLEEDPFVSI